MLQTTWQDVRIAGRLLRKSPTFTITAALSLAVGIGANTAIFSLVNALLLKARPGIHQPGQLVDVGRSTDGRGFDNSSYPNYIDLRDEARSFAGLAAYRLEPIAMSLRDAEGGPGNAEAESIYTITASENFFSVLGTNAAAGRLFGPDEDARARTHPTMVLSHALWERKYNRDPGVVGRAVLVNGTETVVIGVAEDHFRGTNFISPDAWLPIGSFPTFNAQRIGGADDLLAMRRGVWLALIGRLQPDVAPAQAQAELTTIAAQLERAYPDSNRAMTWRVAASSLVPTPVRGPVTGFLGLLMTIVGLVLLIACVNLVGVLVARGMSRRREVAVRLAIGASRGRLVRQLVTETLLVFALGCGAGVLFASWLTNLLASTTSSLPFPVALDLGLDRRVLLFAVLLTLMSGLLSGLLPALQSARTDLVMGLKDDPGRVVFRRVRLRGALVVGQVALSCLLFLAAALLTRSLQHAAEIHPGFEASGVDVITLDLTMGGYSDEAAAGFAEQVIDRVGSLPGVTHVAVSRVIPLTGNAMSFGRVGRPGQDLRRDAIQADWNVVSPGYFETLRVALVRGRAFTDADRSGGPRVTIVNETFARQVWGDADPVGQRLALESFGTTGELTVVGVARDGKYRTLGEHPVPFIYVPLAQQFDRRLSLLVRTAGGTTAIPAVRAALRDLNANLPLIRAERLADAVAIALVPQRLAATLAAGLGLVGLLLAAIGIYGVTAFSVAQRTREIGLRVALGADRSEVLRLVLRQGLLLAASGVALGLALGAMASRLLSSWLYGTGAADGVAYAAVGVLFLAIAGAASYLPARAAARINPLAALRVD
jgi:predicted permease